MGKGESRADVIILLGEVAKGNQELASKLVPLEYDELRRLANRYTRRERTDHTLQPTALVHEAYSKMVEQRSDWRRAALISGASCAELGADFLDRLQPERLTRYYLKYLERLGHKVQLEAGAG